jgi:hypothetical protein
MTPADQAGGWPEDPVQLFRLTVTAGYEGPFERAMNWFWCIDSVTAEITREVPEGSLRDWLACRAETLDRMWRNWHVIRGLMPAERWRRRDLALEDDDEPEMCGGKS